MKQLLSVGGFLLSALCLFSCSKGESYENALPKDAAMVVSIDLASMANKGGLDGENGKAVAARLGNVLKGEMEGSGPLVDKIVENPSESGLDVRDKVYFFVGSQMTSAGMLVRVSDDAKVEGLVDALHAQQFCEEPRESDGCMWTTAGRALVAWTGEAFLILGDPNGGDARDMQHTASMLLRQEAADGFASTPDFGHMRKAGGDMAAFFSLDLLPGEYVAPVTMGVSAELKMQDVKALSVLNFEEGKITVDIQDLTTDKVVNAMKEKQWFAAGEVEGTYLDMFPANTFCWMTANVDGSKVCGLLCENPAVRRQLEDPMLPVDFKGILETIRGDVALAVTDPLTGGFIAYADVTDNRFLRTFEDLKPLLAMTRGQMALLDCGTDAYEFRMANASLFGMRGEIRLWFGVKDNRLYVTNDARLADARVLGMSLRDCPWGSDVAGKRFYMAVNIASAVQKISRVPALRDGAGLQWMALLGGADYLTAGAEDEKTSRIELVMKDKRTNVLRAWMGMLK